MAAATLVDGLRLQRLERSNIRYILAVKFALRAELEDDASGAAASAPLERHGGANGGVDAPSSASSLWPMLGASPKPMPRLHASITLHSPPTADTTSWYG